MIKTIFRDIYFVFFSSLLFLYRFLHLSREIQHVQFFQLERITKFNFTIIPPQYKKLLYRSKIGM